jgi:hypothetical protein
MGAAKRERWPGSVRRPAGKMERYLEHERTVAGLNPVARDGTIGRPGSR